VRAVLDVNVLVSALISPAGAPARLMRAWRHGRFELVVSPLLLDELTRALRYPKLQRYITADEAGELVAWLSREAEMVGDPSAPPTIRSVDPGDDYLIGLAMAAKAILVSGDDHLLSLSGDLPIHRPARFLELLPAEEG
jgi:uncharacterized protein